MRGLRHAIGLLTRIPVTVPDDEARGRAVPWYPVVGAGIGVVVGASAYGAAQIVPGLAAGLVAVAVSAAMTGALHLDGLADVFDGFVGGTDRDRRLEIMRDPRLGTYGATALFLALALQAALLGVLAETPFVVAAAAAAGAVSRAVVVVVMGTAPTARGGLGASHAAAATGGRVVAAAVVGVAVAAAGGAGAAPGLVAAAVAGGAMTAWARRRIGGFTGDVLGAVQVMAELGFLIAVVGAARW